jgi:uncharacterized protein YndB with AHSA1/START domain
MVPTAKAEMLIRRPVEEVFEAFVNPEITSSFWFTRGSGRLESGKQVEWTWGMYNISALVDVKEIDLNRFIRIEWPSENAKTTVEWRFTKRSDDTTFVSITNYGFRGSQEEIVRQAVDSTEGFAIVLAGAKCWLEHGIRLNLVADRFPPDV